MKPGGLYCMQGLSRYSCRFVDQGTTMAVHVPIHFVCIKITQVAQYELSE